MMKIVLFGSILGFMAATSCQQDSVKPIITSTQENDSLALITNKAEIFNSLKKEELIKFLPDVKGFIRNGQPTGESAHIGKSGSKYYSYARQEYKRDSVLYTLEIVDYIDDTVTFRGLVKMYNSLSEDVISGETKMTKTAADRFIINAISTNADKKGLATLLAAVPLDKLPRSW